MAQHPAGFDLNDKALVYRFLKPALALFDTHERPVRKLAPDAVIITDKIKKIIPRVNPPHLDVGTHLISLCCGGDLRPNAKASPAP
jgi:hypothetical protein